MAKSEQEKCPDWRAESDGIKTCAGKFCAASKTYCCFDCAHTKVCDALCDEVEKA